MSIIGEGSHIGRYRLTRRIGEGGMGEVYLAERESDFTKRVAIKLIRPHLVRPDIVRGFTVERQTLASLNHPHIVKLLDGGTTQDGAPYLVTEFVEGVRIDQYCGQHQLGIHERLRLFTDVCAAVHYAHQRLVIHCDLKPQNILVTADGAPMLLDFGIAKLLDPVAVGVTQPMPGETRAGGFTPQYASPEQLLGLPVTTATDTFALGTILYELLTGQPPHQVSGAMADWVRSICERDAEPPSTAVLKQTVLLADTVPNSTLRRDDPQAIGKRLRGDLDAIVLKSLRKEPRDRYGSVDQMAEDIRRHLDGRPVLAHKNTTQYVVRKFLTRHKWSVAAAAVLAVAVIGGVASTLYQARIAARRFEDVRQLARTFLFEVHDSIQDLPGSTPARSIIARTGTDYLDRLARDARGDRSLQIEVAEGYLKIGDVEGNPYSANLGDTGKAIASYRKALALAESIGGNDAKTKQTRARIHENLATVIPFEGKAPEALEHAQRAVVLYQEVSSANASDAEAKLDLARGYETQGDLQGGARGINSGRLTDANGSYERSLAAIPNLPSSHPSSARASRARAVIVMKLGDMQARSGKLGPALVQYQAALEVAERLSDAEPNNTRARGLVTAMLDKIASAHMSQEDNAATEAAFRRALALNERGLAADPNNEKARSGLIVTQKNLGDLYYYNTHNFPEAFKAYKRVAGLLEEQLKTDSQNIVWRQNLSEVLSYVASALLEMKRPAEARPEAQRSLAIAKEIADRPGATHDQIYNYAWLGITIEPADLRDGRAVLPYAEKAAALSGGKDPFDLHVLAQAHAAAGDLAGAVTLEEKALALFAPVEPGKPAPAARGTVEKYLADYRRAVSAKTSSVSYPGK